MEHVETKNYLITRSIYSRSNSTLHIYIDKGIVIVLFLYQINLFRRMSPHSFIHILMH